MVFKAAKVVLKTLYLVPATNPTPRTAASRTPASPSALSRPTLHPHRKRNGRRLRRRSLGQENISSRWPGVRRVHIAHGHSQNFTASWACCLVQPLSLSCWNMRRKVS